MDYIASQYGHDGFTKLARDLLTSSLINFLRGVFLMFKRTMLSRSLLVAFGSNLLGVACVSAQEAPAANGSVQLDRVTVTGSNIRRTDSETPSPVQVITSADLKASGYTSVQEVLQNITANGQGTLSQGFNGAFASGASGIALRGLTVGGTLVLIDGRRAAPYPIGDDGQRSFVDISNIPFDAVERIEILKDGASAVYGSDAIAGVVNIILKRSYNGASITADTGVSSKRDGGTYHVSGIFGTGDLAVDGYNAYFAAELRKQNQIKVADRPGALTRTDYTSNGGYDLTFGVPRPSLTLAASGTGYVTNSAGAIIGFMPGCDATRYSAGKCTYSDNWSQLQVPTENRNLVGRVTKKLGPDWEMSLQGSFFESISEQVNTPYSTAAFQGITSGPGVTPTLLATIPRVTIPSTNPSFPVGTGATSGILRYTFLDVGPRTTDTDAQTSRFVADIKGHADAWDLDAAVGYSQVLLNVIGRNYVRPANLQAALNSTTAPYIVGGPNSSSVLSFIAPTLSTDDSSKLSFAHIGAGREVATLPGGALAIALGADYQHRTQHSIAPDAVANGLQPGFSNNYTIGTQNVSSAYAELVAPVLKQLELDGAVRYDRYNISGGKASPKVGFKYTPVPEFAFRGTASRGFRAPGPAENGTAGQTFFAGTTNDPILCPNPTTPTASGNFPTQCAIQVGTIQSTSKDLKAETSKSFTLGLIVEPIRSLSATLDLYSIEIQNQIVAGGPTASTRGTDFSPIAQVQANGSTVLVAPPVAPIAYQSVGYINANSTKTQGAEIGLQFRQRFEGIGDFKSDFSISYTSKYDITIDGVTYKLAGTHGPSITSGDTGNPRTRIQWINTLSRGPWQVSGTINYISSFDVTDPAGQAMGASAGPQDTCLSALTNQGGTAGTAYAVPLANGVIPSGVSCRVASFTTFDLSGRWDITKQFSIHGSVRNVFNRSAPLDWVTYANSAATSPYNPSLHSAGAIGRYFTVGATYTF